MTCFMKQRSELLIIKIVMTISLRTLYIYAMAMLCGYGGDLLSIN